LVQYFSNFNKRKRNDKDCINKESKIYALIWKIKKLNQIFIRSKTYKNEKESQSLNNNQQTNKGHNEQKLEIKSNIKSNKENVEILESPLVKSIRESRYGPEYFAEMYDEHIRNGGDPDVF
jgi:hypothetical protein